MIIIDREKLAYSADLFDGEGSSRFCLYNGKNRTIRLQVKMADVDAIRKFWEAISNRAKIYGPYRERKYKNFYKDQYQLLIQNFEEFQFVMCLLWNWLSKTKRNQFKETMRAYLSYREEQ